MSFWGQTFQISLCAWVFEEKFIIGSHRLISLHDYQSAAGIRSEALSGKIGDPKSTVVVGALLNSVSSFQLTNYSFKSENLKLKTTSNFIGEMETSGQIRKNKVIIDNINDQNNDEFTYEFTNPVHFGARQINGKIGRHHHCIDCLCKWWLRPYATLTVTLRRIAEAFDDDDFGSNQDLEAKKNK